MNKKNRGTLISNIDENIRMKEKLFQPAVQLYYNHNNIENPEQIEEILPILMQIEYFKTSCPQGYDLKEFVSDIITKLQFEQFEKDEAIFHLGEQGDKFYLILSGQVSIFIPRDEQKIKEEETQLDGKVKHHTSSFQVDMQICLNAYFILSEGEDTTKAKRRTMRKQMSKQQNQLDQELQLMTVAKQSGRLNQYFTDLGVCRYQPIVNLYAGSIFGEQALTTDKPRGATIITKTPLFVLSLNKANYKKVFDKQIKATNQKIDFFMKIFPGTTRFNISKFILYFKDHTFAANVVLWQEDDPADFFLLLSEGQLQLEKKIYEIQENKVTGLIKKQKKQKIIISQVTKGNFVGDQELLQNTHRTYTCRTIECCKAFTISQEDFNITKKLYPEVYQTLALRVDNTKWKEERIQQVIDTNHVKAHFFEGKKQEKFIERRRVVEIEEQFFETFKGLPQIEKNLHHKKSTHYQPISRLPKPAIRSNEIKRQTKQELINYNENVYKSLQTIQEAQGVEMEFNLLKMADENIQKSLKIRVEKQYENHQPAKPKGQTPHFFKMIEKDQILNSLNSLLSHRTCKSQLEDDQVNQNKQQFKISSYIDEEMSSIVDTKHTFTQTGFKRIIHPSLITKTRDFYNKRPSKDLERSGQKFKTTGSEEKQTWLTNPNLSNNKPIHSNTQSCVTLKVPKISYKHKSFKLPNDDKKVCIVIYSQNPYLTAEE